MNEQIKWKLKISKDQREKNKYGRDRCNEYFISLVKQVSQKPHSSRCCCSDGRKPALKDEIVVLKTNQINLHGNLTTLFVLKLACP